MAEVNSSVVGGRFVLMFGNYKVFATDCSTNLNPSEVAEQPSSDGVVFMTETPKAPTMSGTLIITAATDKVFLLGTHAVVTVIDLATMRKEAFYGLRISGGLEHDHKTGLAPFQAIALSAEAIA